MSGVRRRECRLGRVSVNVNMQAWLSGDVNGCCVCAPFATLPGGSRVDGSEIVMCTGLERESVNDNFHTCLDLFVRGLSDASRRSRSEDQYRFYSC